MYFFKYIYIYFLDHPYELMVGDDGLPTLQELYCQYIPGRLNLCNVLHRNFNLEPMRFLCSSYVRAFASRISWEALGSKKQLLLA